MARKWLPIPLILVFLAAVIFASVGCSSSSKPQPQPQPQPSTQESSENRNVMANLHFTVSLESNPSEGYAWKLAQSGNTNVVKYLDNFYVAAAGAMPGAAGQAVWQFQAQALGDTSVVLEYNGPGGNTSTPAKRHTVNLSVKSQADIMTETIYVRTGQNFVLTLDSDPSTGYSWEVHTSGDGRVEQFVSKTFVPGGAQLGAPGAEQCTFKATGAGTTTLVMHYNAAGVVNETPIKKDTVTVTVIGNS